MAKLSWCQMSIPLASLFAVNYALQPTPGHSRLMQPVPGYSNPLQATPTNSNPLQATPTNSSHSNPFHAVLTYCRPLHLLQTTLKIQPHPIWNHSWLPDTLQKIFEFYFFFNSNDWINHLNHYPEKIFNFGIRKFHKNI